MSLCDWPVVLVDDEGHKIRVRCSFTDAAMCESCSSLHAGDVRRLIIEGMGDSPCTFVTFTAPGREIGGSVHSLRAEHGVARRCSCGSVHSPTDDQIGTPVHPDTFDYTAVADWNAHARRLLTITIQKVARLNRQPVVWVGVPELQTRGLLHFHIVIRGIIPAHIIDLAVNGGPSLRGGRSVTPASHAGHRFGQKVDVQLVCDDHGRRRTASYLAKYLTKASTSSAPKQISAVMLTHRTQLAYAVKAHVGHCTHVGHGRVPGAIYSRFAPWGFDYCPRRRRAIRQAGHTGRTFGRSRSWPMTMGELQARRISHVTDLGGPKDEGAATLWTYAGRGYERAATLSDLLNIAGLTPAPASS